MIFAPGENSKTITVEVAGDTVSELDETFTLALTNATSGVVIASDTAIATIENDDPAIVGTIAGTSVMLGSIFRYPPLSMIHG